MPRTTKHAAGSSGREMRIILRKARERCQMSQAEFGEALGRIQGHSISASQISDWERGRFPPGGSVLLAAADLAGGSLDELRSEGHAVSIEEYNELAQRVLERAQAVLGIRSAEAFAKLLADRGAGSPDGSTYRRWLRGENIIPAWALIAAAQVCDRDLSSLLAEAGTVCLAAGSPSG